jgi:hypothetical protein
VREAQDGGDVSELLLLVHSSRRGQATVSKDSHQPPPMLRHEFRVSAHMMPDGAMYTIYSYSTAGAVLLNSER